MLYNAFRYKWLWIITDCGSFLFKTDSLGSTFLRKERLLKLYFCLPRELLMVILEGKKICKYPTYSEALNLFSSFTNEIFSEFIARIAT